MTAEDLYHQLFETTPAALLTVDRDGHIVDCNRPACIQFARARSELLGTPVLRWITASDRPRCKAYFLQAFQGGTVEWKARIERGDGQRRILALRAVLRAPGTSRDRLHVFAQDLSDNRPGRPDVAQLQAVLENLPGQFVATLDPGGRIRYSCGLARTLWYDDAESLGRDPGFFFVPGRRGRALLDVMRRATAAGEEWEGTPWLVRADGSRLPVRIYAVPYRDPRMETVIGTLMVGQDVSREHEAREALEEAGRFAAIGRVVASIAQALAEPVARIRAWMAHPGEDGDGAPAGPWPAADVARLDRLAHAVEAYIGDARGECTAIDVGPMVAEIAEAERRTLDDAGIELATSPAEGLPWVHIDPAHLQRIVRGLLTNAREAVAFRTGGAIRIDVECGDHRIALHVRDNGPGIPRELREQVFEPFFTTKSDHLGLGLATAQGIINAYGGRIWCARSEDHWTTFSVELPIDPLPATSAFRPVPLMLRRARSVLVVDDDAAVRTTIRKFLEKLGHRVLEAWSGRSALAHITSGMPPELVVTDLKMTDGTGYWLLHQLERDFPAVLRRTVIITGDHAHAAVDRIARKTGCPVVRKPFEFQSLLERLDEVALRD